MASKHPSTSWSEWALTIMPAYTRAHHHRQLPWWPRQRQQNQCETLIAAIDNWRIHVMKRMLHKETVGGRFRSNHQCGCHPTQPCGNVTQAARRRSKRHLSSHNPCQNEHGWRNRHEQPYNALRIDARRRRHGQPERITITTMSANPHRRYNRTELMLKMNTDGEVAPLTVIVPRRR